MQFLYEEFKKYGSVSIDTEGREPKDVAAEIVALIRSNKEKSEAKA